VYRLAVVLDEGLIERSHPLRSKKSVRYGTTASPPIPAVGDATKGKPTSVPGPVKLAVEVKDI
jgi:hypothetical protein